MNCYDFDGSLIVLVCGASWVVFMVVLILGLLWRGSWWFLVVVPVVVFGGGWCCFLVTVNGGFCGGQW